MRTAVWRDGRRTLTDAVDGVLVEAIEEVGQEACRHAVPQKHIKQLCIDRDRALRLRAGSDHTREHRSYRTMSRCLPQSSQRVKGRLLMLTGRTQVHGKVQTVLRSVL